MAPPIRCCLLFGFRFMVTRIPLADTKNLSAVATMPLKIGKMLVVLTKIFLAVTKMLSAVTKMLLAVTKMFLAVTKKLLWGSPKCF